MQSQKDKFCHCTSVQRQTKNLLLSAPIQEDLQTWHFKEILSIGLSNVGNDYIKKFISLTGGLSHEFVFPCVGFKMPHGFIASKVLPAVSEASAHFNCLIHPVLVVEAECFMFFTAALQVTWRSLDSGNGRIYLKLLINIYIFTKYAKVVLLCISIICVI